MTKELYWRLPDWERNGLISKHIFGEKKQVRDYLTDLGRKLMYIKLVNEYNIDLPSLSYDDLAIVLLTKKGVIDE